MNPTSPAGINMKFLTNLSIRWKLTLLMLVVTLVAMLAAACGLIVYEVAESRQQATEELKVTAHLMSANTVAAMIFDDPEAAKENLRTLRVHPHIIAAQIFKITGVPFANYVIDSVKTKRFFPEMSQKEGYAWQGLEVSLFHPIEKDGRFLGTLCLQADMHYLVEKMKHYLIILFSIMLLGFLMAILLSDALQRFVSVPILTLTKVAEDVRRKKDYSMRISGKPSRDEMGRLTEAFNQMLDEIEQRTQSLERANVELRKLDQLKTEFIMTVSHELRTPLLPIREGINIILTGLTGEISEEQKTLLEVSRRNVDRLAHLIGNVLDFQKLEMGVDKMIFTQEDMNAIIREFYDLGLVWVKQRALDLELDLEEPLPKVRCDKGKITQILFNLLHNAVKFTEKGKIMISTRLEGEQVRVTVQDTGKGFDLKDASKLFAPFVQLNNDTNDAIRKIGGTGLGLVICERIIEQHGGNIGVDSKPQIGSSFYFTVPLASRR